MPTPEETRKAAGSDVAVWGEKDVSGCYPPGTMWDLGDGKPIDVSKVPDVIGGGGKPESNDRPARGTRNASR